MGASAALHLLPDHDFINAQKLATRRTSDGEGHACSRLGGIRVLRKPGDFLAAPGRQKDKADGGLGWLIGIRAFT
jgi:hypothetical protein